MIERLQSRRLILGLSAVLVLVGTSVVIGPRALSHVSRPPAEDRLDDLNLLAAATPLPAPVRQQPVSVKVGLGNTATSASQPTAQPTAFPAAATNARRTVAVRRGSIADVLPLTGRVVAEAETTVTTPRGGQVSMLAVAPGQQISAGDVLAALDTQQLEHDLAGARTRLDDTAARVEAAQAQADAQQHQDERRQSADRAQRDGGLSQADASLAHALSTLQGLRSTVSPDQAGAVDAALADVSQSRAALSTAAAAIRAVPDAGATPPVDVAGPRRALEQAQAQVEQIENQIAASHVQAPFSGTVVAVRVRQGDQVQQDQALITLAKPGETLVDISLTDADAARLAVGQSARVTLPGTTGDATSDASIIALTPAHAPRPAIARLRVHWVSAPPGYGKAVDVLLTLETRTDALIVPTKAIHTIGARHLVDSIDGSARHSVPVQIGIVTPQDTEILNGLTEGQAIQVSP